MTWTIGDCPYCRRTVEIRDDGFIAAHTVPQPSAVDGRSYCAASNTFQATWKKDHDE